MKILFFIENNWCYGKIHNELIKVLYPEIYCDIIHWHGNFTVKDFEFFDQKYDYVLTSLSAIHILINDCKLNPKKIIATAHGDRDLIDYQERNPNNEILDIGGYFVISKKLHELSIKFISRIPDILPIGTFTKNYPQNNNTCINNIGYFSIPSIYNHYNIDIKRGHLVEKVANEMKIPLIHSTNSHFLGVENLYKDISLLMFSSLTEGLPYISTEAFSCGIPVLGTDVGTFSERIQNGGGYVLPFREEEYIIQACDLIKKINSTDGLYQQLKQDATNIGIKYDWSNIRYDWINYFYSI